MRKLSIFLLSFFLFTACDELQNPDIDEMLSDDKQEEVAGDALHISELKFSEDNKEIHLSIRLLHDVGDYDLMDSTKVVMKILQEIQVLPGKYGNEIQPVVTKISNPSREILKKLNLKLLLLVDLSLPQKQIDEELRAVKEIRAHLGHDDNIYIAFLQGDNISETYEATDYIIGNYFIHREPAYTYLYRSILTKLNEFSDESTTIGKAKHKVMIIMSGGKTYENDKPIDPNHFALQQQLADKTQEFKNSIWAYYANFSTSVTNEDEIFALSDNSSDSNILQYFCQDLNGIYQTAFNWQEMEDDMLKDFHINLSNYNVTLENPDGKIFRGDLHKLQVGFYDKETGDLVAKGTTDFSLGTVYHPVIVRDIPMSQVIATGILTTLFILFIVWIIFQFIEPYIRYWFFKRKYIISYVGNSMSVEGQSVNESCYLCKGAFEKGDEIVIKCKHTMHKECWDANEYHCPEHGRHCKEGSHYYNSHNLLDSHNTLFYLKWIIAAIIAGFSAWCLFINKDSSISLTIIDYMHKMYHELTSTTDQDRNLPFVYGAYLSDLPGFGQIVGFTLTFFLSFLTVNKRKWIQRLAEILIRSLIAALVGCLCCIFGCLISIFLHLDSATFLIDWIPWTLLSCVILLAVSIKTRTPIRKTFLLAACGISVLSMLVWGVVYYNTVINYRLSLLIGFIIYTVAIAVCIAKVTPHSERYFLHVEGAIKEMDIALFKWIRNDPSHSVTIGKSVDCSIQLSWDINSQVAPVQAEIKRHLDSILLTALEDGVFVNDKPLAQGDDIWLYHGRKFTIGNTTFTYIEKDL